MEMKIKIPYGMQVTEISQTPEGEILIKFEKDAVVEWGFQPISLEGYSMDSPGMGFEPEGERGKFLKNGIRNAFENGVKEFWATKKVLHNDEDGRYTFEDKGYWGWENFHYFSKLAREVDPTNDTRLGTPAEFFAFLAIDIIHSCEAGMEPEMAWENAEKFAGRCDLLVDPDTGNGIMTGSLEWIDIDEEMKDTKIFACVPWIVCR